MDTPVRDNRAYKRISSFLFFEKGVEFFETRIHPEKEEYEFTAYSVNKGKYRFFVKWDSDNRKYQFQDSDGTKSEYVSEERFRIRIKTVVKEILKVLTMDIIPVITLVNVMCANPEEIKDFRGYLIKLIISDNISISQMWESFESHGAY